MDDVLSEYSDVISSEPGHTDALKLSINTGEQGPLQNHPYRIPPRWKEEVRIEIDKLFQLGIIGRVKRAPHWGVQSRFRVI